LEVAPGRKSPHAGFRAMTAAIPPRRLVSLGLPGNNGGRRLEIHARRRTLRVAPWSHELRIAAALCLVRRGTQGVLQTWKRGSGWGWDRGANGGESRARGRQPEIEVR
jgi:hypothetical protein